MSAALIHLPSYLNQLGIKKIVLSPGSRSAPLALTLSRSNALETFVVVDERTAGFTALGMAQITQEPVGLVCTSGTALANYFPAVIEAFYRKISLVILTADRPEELLRIHDGQAIEQEAFFGAYSSFSYSFSPQFDEKTLHQVFENARAMLPKGGIHLNFRFREPLYQIEQSHEPNSVLIDDVITPKKPINKDLVQHLKLALESSKRPLFVLGQTHLSHFEKDLLKEFLVSFPMPLLADATAQFGAELGIQPLDWNLNKLIKAYAPDLLLFGGFNLSSKALKTWLRSLKDLKGFQFDLGESFNPFGIEMHFLEGNPNQYLRLLVDTSTSKENLNWARLHKELKPFVAPSGILPGELSTAAMVLKLMPQNYVLHLGNSMPVRWANWLGVPANQGVFSNRGASGIDGVVSTAIGSALASSDQNHFLLCGDLTFLYDSNAFWQQRVPDNLKILILNNQGGGIFRLIDGPASQPELEQIFTTKALSGDASFICARFGIHYENIAADSLTEQQLKTFFALKKTAVMEVFSNPETDVWNFKLLKEEAGR